MEQQLNAIEETAQTVSSWGVPSDSVTRTIEPPAESFVARPLTVPEVNATNPLIYRLRKNSPVRRLALAALRGEQITTIAPLLDALNFPSGNAWKTRQVAAWTLGRARLTPEQQEVAASALVRVVGNRLDYDGGRIIRGLLRTLLTSTLISLAAAAWVMRTPNTTLFPLLMVMVLGFTILCSPGTLSISFSTDDEKANRVRASAIEALGSLRRPETLETLLAAHLGRGKRLRSAATSALRQVLPQLTPDHYGRLGASVTPNLCQALSHWDNVFVLEIVEALGKVGDGRALTVLERLERSEKRADVRIRIAEIMPMLLERSRREQESGVLLRGSLSPAGPEELLRASITDGPDDAHETLLRATRGDEP